MLYLENAKYFPIKNDCVNCKERECIALTKTYCKINPECRFYKTRIQLEKQIERIRERIPDYGFKPYYYKATNRNSLTL